MCVTVAGEAREVDHLNVPTGAFREHPKDRKKWMGSLGFRFATGQI